MVTNPCLSLELAIILLPDAVANELSDVVHVGDTVSVSTNTVSPFALVSYVFYVNVINFVTSFDISKSPAGTLEVKVYEVDLSLTYILNLFCLSIENICNVSALVQEK